MKNRAIYVIALAGIFVLSACSSVKTPEKTPAGRSSNSQCPTSTSGENSVCSAATSTPATSESTTSQLYASVTDDQGAVTIEITPLSLDPKSDSFVFDVSMNTHSVDLNQDIAQLSTLSTNTGTSVLSSNWEGPSGGHHVEGRLAFPAMVDGKSILDGVTSITITIKDIAVPTRTFSWQISK
jgi:hypothetical protein